MNKYNNPRLLNAVVSGTGMKHPIQPHVVVGDVSNGFIRGDLMDANAIVDLVNSGDAIDQETIRQAVADIIGTAPENLDTLGEIAEALDAAVLDPNTEGSLAYKITALENEFDEENADSFASKINSTIEDNELTIAAALNDLNSRLLELVTRVDALDGGGSSSDQILQNGLYKVLTPGETWVCFRADNGRIMVYASDTTASDNINIYGYSNGNYYYSTGGDTYLDQIRTIAEKYTNFVDVSKEQHLHTAGEQLSDWNSYVEFS